MYLLLLFTASILWFKVTSCATNPWKSPFFPSEIHLQLSQPLWISIPPASGRASRDPGQPGWKDENEPMERKKTLIFVMFRFFVWYKTQRKIEYCQGILLEITMFNMFTSKLSGVSHHSFGKLPWKDPLKNSTNRDLNWFTGSPAHSERPTRAKLLLVSGAHYSVQ